VRYDSPVGPIRLDIGFRVPGLQAIGESSLPLSHGQERPDLYSSCTSILDPKTKIVTGQRCVVVPAAINVAIGEAF
jgi:hypothetical protein